jgi:large subunit ribosomal protein L4
MVDCAVKNWEGEAVGTASLELKVAPAGTASHVVHRALVRQRTNARQGTASAKTRSEVRGGGRKPWRQKGTGRARAGSMRSPLRKGGGVIFPPKPRDFALKMNRKELRLALRTALQSRSDELTVVQDFSEQLPQPKTKTLVAALQRWGLDPQAKILMLLPQIPQPLYLSARNVPNLKLLRADALNVYDLLDADSLVATPEALATIQEVYQ